MDDLSQGDICRVCRCEAQQDRPLFYPCICTGSIKYIHQDCLMQWMRYSHKEYCELCGHRFSFQPIYAPDMPRVLPLKDVIVGLMAAVIKGAKSWCHYSLVGIAWFGVVPLSAYRTYRYLFRASSFDMILALPFDIFSTENLASDAFRGCFVVTCTLLSFIGLVWLREQILHGGGPDWLERDDAPPAAAVGGAVNDDDADAGVQVDDANVAADGVQPAAGAADVAAAAAARNDDNNNAEAPRDIPMNNAAPAVANPADNEGEQPLDQGAGVAGAAAAGGDAVVAENDNEEPNWNPMEWDRAAEELTWERLLGLDGSLVFLEHVFWIISLNTMFIFTFAFCPYCVGNFVLNSLDLLEPDKPILHFHGLITTLFGYSCIGMTLVVMHFFARVFHLRRVRWLIGLCYIVVKVALLSVVEIGVLPLICGWWLDICSLPLFDASIKERKASFQAAPGTSLFVHWMFGMIYVYYFAAFISLLREVLRPGVLWIFRNVNDPDFSPIQEMIHVPILRHIRRLIASAMIFGCSVLLMLWLPIRLMNYISPSFLPYTLSGDSEVNDLSLQLMLLQIVLPGFFEQSHTRIWLKGLLRIWCVSVAWLLGLRSYLLGNEEAQQADEQQPAAGAPDADANVENAAEQQQPQAAAAAAVPLMAAAAVAAAAPAPPPPVVPVRPAPNLGAAHQAIMQRDVNTGYQPYDRPTLFPVRLCFLVLFMCVSIVFGAMLILTVPIWIGRKILSLWSANNSSPSVLKLATGAGRAAAVNGGVQRAVNPEATGIAIHRPHELYTAELGAYLCWIISRAIAVAVTLLPQGRAAVINKLKHWFHVAASYALPLLIFVLMLGVIPLLFGLLLELVVVIPLRVPLFQTPLHFPWQDWALGVLYTKIAIALTLMGPDWHLKRAIERAYRDGLRDIDLKFVINELAVPVISSFSLALAVPYVLAYTITPLLIKDPFAKLTVSRLIYPVFFMVIGSVAYVLFEIKQFKKLYMSIKVDKYLVGQRLINYEHRKKQQQEAQAAAAAEAASTSTAAAAAKANEQQTTVAGAASAGKTLDAVALEAVVPKLADELVAAAVNAAIVENEAPQPQQHQKKQQKQPLIIIDDDVLL